MAPGAAEHILLKVDVQMLFPGIIITAGTRDIVYGFAVCRTGNADQRDNIRNMDFDHAASFPGDALRIPLMNCSLYGCLINSVGTDKFCGGLDLLITAIAGSEPFDGAGLLGEDFTQRFSEVFLNGTYDSTCLLELLFRRHFYNL